MTDKKYTVYLRNICSKFLLYLNYIINFYQMMQSNSWQSLSPIYVGSAGQYFQQF